MGSDPVTPFPPVAESLYQSEEEAFISDFRYNKHSLDIPWMVGLNSDDGLIKTAGKFLRFFSTHVTYLH